MPLLANKPGNKPKMELKPNKCINTVLKPLTDHVTIKINGSLTSKDVFHTIVSMAVDKNSVHSVAKQYLDVECETSLRYHLKKLTWTSLSSLMKRFSFKKL